MLDQLARCVVASALVKLLLRGSYPCLRSFTIRLASHVIDGREHRGTECAGNVHCFGTLPELDGHEITQHVRMRVEREQLAKDRASRHRRVELRGLGKNEEAMHDI